jgi:tetratricopeptide (TPR) repeat protein
MNNQESINNTSNGKRFPVRQNGRKQELTYVQLFCVGHRKWHRRQFEMAKAIFEQLCTVKDRGPRAEIFLAHCHAMLGDFAQCSAILHRALPEYKYGNAAARLHDAFVFWNVGLFVDVKNAMKALAREYEELPSLSLILAELLHCTGARRLSARYLRHAMEHDRKNGAVSQAAEFELKEIENETSS